MGRSQRLRFDDIRNVFRLVGECCELGQKPETWRQHMLMRLNQMVGARVSYALQARPPLVNNMSTVTSFIADGLNDNGHETMFKYFFEGGYKEDATYPALIPYYLRGQHFTVRRRELLDDGPWYSSEVTQRNCEALGTDDFMSTQFFIVPPFTTHAINFHRDKSDRRPFDIREERITQLFHTELGRLWDKKDLPKPDPCEGLSPRMRQIIAFIREGFSEKEIAAKTKLSQHTVHDYIKRLHTHFSVSNRAGLLVATNPPPVPYRPALSP